MEGYRIHKRMVATRFHIKQYKRKNRLEELVFHSD